MKKIITSVGMLAVSAAGLQAAYAPGLSSMETSKPWSVSASLRGFYDDNYTTSPKALARDSFGVELSPSASLNLPMDQTFLGLSYAYSMRYYEDRRSADQSHQFNGKLDHAFTERYKISLDESFVIAQEPSVIERVGLISVPLRIKGNNIRNTGSANFTAQLTPLLSLQVGYANTLYDYEDKGTNSYSARLDRMEHLGSLNLRYQMMRQTIGILGYQYGVVDYTSGDSLLTTATLANPAAVVSPSMRNNRSHYAFIGADQNFNSQLNGSLRVGAQFTDYYNQGVSDVSPYADANLTYAYAPGDSLQVGLRHSRNQTDQFDGSAGNLTLDQQSTGVYSTITHRLTSKITATALGQYQRSIFQGGSNNDGVDNIFLVGLNIGYRINPHFLAEIGYNFDRLDSDVGGRSYTRNRAYIGVRATY